MKTGNGHRTKDTEQETKYKGAFRLLFYLFAIMLISVFAASAGVKDTKHNLSVSGPGAIKAVSETEICIFCHTPHNSRPETPLWNHDLSSVTNYINYSSGTLQAYSGEENAPGIDGVSKLCLSCHDGTIALGAVASREDDIEMVNIPDVVEAGILSQDAEGYLGSDLSGGHPISFVFDEALKAKRHMAGLSELKWPVCKSGEHACTGDRDVKIYPTQGGYGVQCSSCHDPHGNKGAPGEPPLWRKSLFNEVCEVCHEAIGFIGH